MIFFFFFFKPVLKKTLIVQNTRFSWLSQVGTSCQDKLPNTLDNFEKNFLIIFHD